MEMTFKQYIDNPMGKKNAVFSQREVFKKIYTAKFDRIFLRETGKINYMLYFDKPKDRYIIHIKIPSETVENFYYDAVIMFYTNDAAERSSTKLDNYFVKFFSNDPAFVFTYLRVFLKNNLFIEELKSKAPKLALKKDPKIKNPYETPGYSKILFFAYIFMKNKNLFAKHMYTSYGQPYNVKTVLANIEDGDTKIAKRQELGKSKNIEMKRRDRDAVLQSRRREVQNKSQRSNKISTVVKNVSSIGKTKQVSKTKTTRNTKKK